MVMLRKGEPALVLAPMEGVTDAPMRALLAECGGFDFAVAEYLRVSQVVPGARVLHRHVPELGGGARTAAGLPVQVQLLGGHPERLAATAAMACAAGAPAIDLNFGCPARTVNRHDGGASLLQHPQRIFAIVAAVRAAVPAHIPVSAKLRLGWESPYDIFANAERALAGGASWLTVHARTRMQAYRPPALWAPLRQLAREASVVVVANGDLWDLDALRRCRDITGCHHFMLGRGAVANPYLARQLAAELGLPLSMGPALPWPALLRRFVHLSDVFGARPGAVVGRLKQWARMSPALRKNGCYAQIRTLQSIPAILATAAALLDEACADAA